MSLLANLEGSWLLHWQSKARCSGATPAARMRWSLMSIALPWNQATNFPRRRHCRCCRDLTLQPPRCNLRSTRERFTGLCTNQWKHGGSFFLLTFNCRRTRARASREQLICFLSLSEAATARNASLFYSHANARAFTCSGRAVLNAPRVNET